jgi:3-methyladenine DNA glycosylase/8-oxoguanine DNA glycosylase
MAISHQDASAVLAERDEVMAQLAARHGPMRIPAAPRADQRFASLANAITSQQLNGRAAATIWGRLVTLVGEPFSADAVSGLPVTALREAGLSGSKASSLLDLAAHVDDGRINLLTVGRLGDDEVIDHLTMVRGIGPWTAQMFLIFTLRRLDVWPTGDYGVRSGYGRAYQGGRMPEAKELVSLGDKFRPFRSVAAWYCWKAADDPDFG